MLLAKARQHQMQESSIIQLVNLLLAVGKPLEARWVIKLLDYIKQNPKHIS